MIMEYVIVLKNWYTYLTVALHYRHTHIHTYAQNMYSEDPLFRGPHVRGGRNLYCETFFRGPAAILIDDVTKKTITISKRRASEARANTLVGDE